MTQEVLSELKRVLGSEPFKSSKRISELLQHIVQTYLDGKSEDLTGITIAQDLFKKGADFDPSKDPVVRVNIARLRKMLSAYYKSEGASNPHRISIPKGGYKPEILKRELPEKSSPKTSIRLNYILGGALVALGLLFAAIYFYEIDTAMSPEPSAQATIIEEIERYPTVAVLPFENKTLDPQYDNLKEGLQRQITVDLYPFRVIRVLQVDKTVEALLQNTESKPDYAITGSVNNVGTKISLTIQLFDLKTGNIILTENVRRESDGENYYETLVQISSELSNNFGGPEGVIVKQQVNNIKQRLSHTSHMVKDLSGLECFSQFTGYRELKTVPKLERTFMCLEEELEHAPDDATLMAALAVIYYEIGFINAHPELKKNNDRLKGVKLDPSVTREKARKLAKQSVELDPRNDIARGYLADIQMADGDISDAYISLQQAMASNRGNPNHISNTALVLSYLGHWDDALPLAKEAIARNPNPDGYYYMPLFYHAIVTKDGAAAQSNLQYLQRGMSTYLRTVFKFLAASLSDDQDTLNTLRKKVQELFDANKDDPLYVIRLSGGSDEIFAAMRDEFTKAGIVFYDDLDDKKRID